MTIAGKPRVPKLRLLLFSSPSVIEPGLYATTLHCCREDVALLCHCRTSLTILDSSTISPLFILCVRSSCCEFCLQRNNNFAVPFARATTPRGHRLPRPKMQLAKVGQPLATTCQSTPQQPHRKVEPLNPCRRLSPTSANPLFSILLLNITYISIRLYIIVPT